ncbi:heme o synthase [Corynebacterium ulceribovis]|uniref:heme o synthase n=1 Tax=Corynebacterium ulceribovis TaxID=487732 RepID=UPI000371A97E|nr:heme o synthase [Corynebacterium ulceribovis]
MLDTVKAYIALTKPRVIELLLVAAIPAMLQADRQDLNAMLILLTLVGGWMGAASANVYNMVADSDIDKKMRRTRRRPLARESVSNRAAMIFATVLMVASFLWLWLLCNSLLAGIFILITIAFYVFVYTMWLKRRTDQNVVWGGAAGCMPVLVGWAVITDANPGEPAHWWQAIVLFLVIFFWTPPHTWALGLRYKEDYKAAGVPMMPVVKKAPEVTIRIIWYTLATVVTTFLLIPAAGWLYALISVLTGAWFLWRAIELHLNVTKGAPIKPMKLFMLSNNYLALWCVGLSVDAFIGLEQLGNFIGFPASLF